MGSLQLSKLHVNNINAKGSSNTGLSINDTGRVTTPNKIAFNAIGNVPNTAGAYTSATPVKPGTVKHNFGNGYDLSTGRFTVPSGGAGLYWFHVHMGIVLTGGSGGNGGSRLFFYNAAGTQLYAPYSYWNHPAAAHYGSIPITATHDLDEGDYVYLTFFSNNATYYADGSELSFQGMLMG